MYLTILKRKINVPERFYWREILAVLLLMIGIYFLHQQRHEVKNILPVLHAANKGWLLLAALVTIIYVLFQSAMYAFSFIAIGQSLPLRLCIELFLKRSFLSVFLPGGGVSALAYVPKNAKKAISNKTCIHQASALFGFAGVLSTFIICIVVLLSTIRINKDADETTAGIIVLSVFVCLLVYFIYAVKKEKRVFRWVRSKYPETAIRIKEIIGADVKTGAYILTVLCSLGVEVCGIAHLYISMRAVNALPSLQAAGLAYIISVLLAVVSPFLKGVGAVELSVAYILGNYGYSAVSALAITLVYRSFEFWLPLLMGLFSFLIKAKGLFLRLYPAFFIFLLGIVNILSVLTPPITERIEMLRSFIPGDTIYATNTLVIYTGVTLIVTAAYLVRGLRSAWWIAFTGAFISLAGHLLKGLDWEEASLALLVLLSLLLTKKQYTARINPKLVGRATKTAFYIFLVLIIYGYIGFYFLEKRHFGIDFNRYQSLQNTLLVFFLQKTSLRPVTIFGKEFLVSMYVFAVGAWAFLLYALAKPYISTSILNRGQQKAEGIVEKYGRSAVDYFKLMEDKLFFFSKKYEAFTAYRIESGFAIVLELPVCASERMDDVLEEFEAHCNKAGLKPAYYRVDERALAYKALAGKKRLLIGQEAIADVTIFDLAGRDKKSLRNGLNSLQKKGYVTRVFKAPHSGEFIQSLKKISDEWLRVHKRKEMVFSQGGFDEDLLQQQDVVATVNNESKPVAFLSIIPDYAPGECTYDLIRKTEDAPGGCMDALIIELIKYAGENGKKYLNLGLAPMSGLQDADTAIEKLMKFAYEKIKRFQHYHGLRSFKEKYASQWLNKYLIYENDFDLVQLPAALNKAMRFKYFL
ncbi:phosphatidylglycerol lysyltransferase domain-containing protein [Parafilimonas sp.]|uniref:phosphatidylglycerol lysyltransferase domain-containing protein n=1 Tax=Parafilimonas sp. TaxID=1969739 RepID=UPI0039E4F3D5